MIPHTRRAAPVTRRGALSFAPAFALIFALALVVGDAAPAAAGSNRLGSTRSAEPAPPAALESSSGEKALSGWRMKLERARSRVRGALSNEKIATRNYTRARTRHYPRGGALLTLRREREEARAERKEAESAFSVVLEQARRAGVGMGVLSPYMDFEDEMGELHARESGE